MNIYLVTFEDCPGDWAGKWPVRTVVESVNAGQAAHAAREASPADAFIKDITLIGTGLDDAAGPAKVVCFEHSGD